MKIYSIYLLTVSHIDSQAALGTILDDLLNYIIIWKFIEHTIDQLFDSTDAMDYLTHSDSYHSDSVECFITPDSTLTLNSKSA